MAPVKATPQFMRLAKKAMTAEALQELVDVLSLQPEKGALIRGTGGVRKVRWRTGKDNKGKSGGVRILYYYGQGVLVLLVTLFRKSEKENIDTAEKNELKKLLPELVRKYKDE